MSLRMKAHQIPQKKGSLQVLGEHPVRLMMEGVTVWELRKLRSIFDASGSWPVPDGVEEITLCATAGGGAGGATSGGGAGEGISNVTITVTPGQVIDIVIGGPGEDTQAGTFNLAAGIPDSYLGNGDSHITCGGLHYDGVESGGLYGGQAGTFGDGGAANAPGNGGGGGGANAIGGPGKVVITYYKG